MRFSEAPPVKRLADAGGVESKRALWPVAEPNRPQLASMVSHPFLARVEHPRHRGRVDVLGHWQLLGKQLANEASDRLDRAVDVEFLRERARVDEARRRLPQLFLEQRRHALGDHFDVVALEMHLRLPFESAVVAARQLALEAMLGDALGRPDKARVELVFCDERPRAVAMLELLAAKVANAVCRLGFGAP